MGFFDLFKRKNKNKKYKMGLHKTREGALSTLKQLLDKNNKITDELFDELEEIFIMADIGVDTVIDFIDDLRSEVANGRKNRHYRLEEYKNRNCENYPTHELGPIAKILNINSGNRFTKLVSMSSKAQGMKQY